MLVSSAVFGEKRLILRCLSLISLTAAFLLITYWDTLDLSGFQVHVDVPNEGSSPAIGTDISHDGSGIVANIDGTAGYPSSEGDPAVEKTTEDSEGAHQYDADIGNATLGFQKILAIGLKERYDRHDNLALMASHQDVQLEWQYAIRGEDIDKQTWPPSWNRGKEQHSMGELGCYRSHMNALQTVVENHWTTALILEDDADWDTALKDQLVQFASHTRSLAGARIVPANQSAKSSKTRPENPYGLTWDLLWLGSCANPKAPEDTRTFSDVNGGQMHFVWYARGGMACTYGYAVTYESAKMLLSWLMDVDAPIDYVMSSFCEKRDCIAVWPELIGSHKPAGSRRKDTDIQRGEDGAWMDEIREVGETQHIVHSAILDALERVKKSS